MSGGRWAEVLIVVLAAVVLGLQMVTLTPTAPVSSAADQGAAASRAEAAADDGRHDDDTHVAQAKTHPFLIRGRQRAADRAPDSSARGAVSTAVTVARGSSTSSPTGDTRGQPGPATGNSPAALQVFRC